VTWRWRIDPIALFFYADRQTAKQTKLLSIAQPPLFSLQHKKMGQKNVLGKNQG
jgi:hypothetical protein